MSSTTQEDLRPAAPERKSEEELTIDRLIPEEEKDLLDEYNKLKASANRLFATADYDEAIRGYDKALASCPNYLDYEIAVLRSNIAACHLKLADWKAAIESATQALDSLDHMDPPSKSGEEAKVEEIDDNTAEKIEALLKGGRTHDEIRKLRAKALLRRAKARIELGGWAALQGADEDYRQLSQMNHLSSLDQQTVRKALSTLPPRLEEAKQKEMGEMMGKLKNLGNGILKPFGLSTDNFNFVKDENTGGYSMQFNQNKK
ncbi:hypothetical protein M501DRAFT_1013628 [Patellaria atrata CBS 101060]|uniref:Tetratricopeptide repeat protein 1 n=1 Tax=Patellaria atrata CBS 101060 TaxID=1346257 RepID=A0A9P4SH39_9PEZI|nr:hypothetical protein M501DRAFT_1013628 [Patellaria atrata CBS 101060]